VEYGDIFQVVDAHLSSPSIDPDFEVKLTTKHEFLWVPRAYHTDTNENPTNNSDVLPARLLTALDGDEFIAASKYWKDKSNSIVERPNPGRKYFHRFFSSWRVLTQSTEKLIPGGVAWISSHEQMFDFLPHILKMAKSGVELACDCEGTAKGFSGKDGMSHLTMTSWSLNHTWIFRTQRIAGVFDIPGDEGQTLRSLLESKTVIQLWFDLRNDTNAIFGCHGIRLGRVRDIQLMEAATRCGPRIWLHSLERCVKDEGRLFMGKNRWENWLWAKEEGREFFNSYGWGVWEWYILPEEAERYISGDASCLFGLEQVYADKMLRVASALQLDYPNMLMEIVDEASEVRLIESTSASYGTNEQSKSLIAGLIRDLVEVWPVSGDPLSFRVLSEEEKAELKQMKEAAGRQAERQNLLKKRKEKSAKRLKFKSRNKRLRRRGSNPRNWGTRRT